MDDKTLSCKYNRNFGIELEVLAFDKRDFQKRPLNRESGELPFGIYNVGHMVSEATGMGVSVNKWHYTSGNKEWVIKPDASCGIEICSPVLKGNYGIEQVCKVVESLKNGKCLADDKCGMHVHVEVADEQPDVLAKIIAYWIKCESVFLDAMPASRKSNRYCQQIGVQDIVEHNTPIRADSLVHLLGSKGSVLCKYFTLNTYHMVKEGRKTIEFRIADYKACICPLYVKHWIRLLVHFVEQAVKARIPKGYTSGDPWSSFLWLDPIDVFKFMGFFDDLSKGLEQTRNWFLARLLSNIEDSYSDTGVWSLEARSVARKQVHEMISMFGLSTEDLLKLINNADEVDLYDVSTRN